MFRGCGGLEGYDSGGARLACYNTQEDTFVFIQDLKDVCGG